MGWLDHMETLFILRFLRNLRTLFHSDWDNNSMQEGSLFSTSSPACIICRIFDDSHSDQCEVIPHWGSDLHFSNNEVMLSVFSCDCWPSVCFLWRNVYLYLLPTFWADWGAFLILSCMRCLYILEINPLLVASFTSIFSHFIGCLSFCWLPLLCNSVKVWIGPI